MVGVGVLFIEPGGPWQNGHAVSFHGWFRDEFLAVEIFLGVQGARLLTLSIRGECNPQQPHSSLDVRSPAEFGDTCTDGAKVEAELAASGRSHLLLGLRNAWPGKFKGGSLLAMEQAH